MLSGSLIDDLILSILSRLPAKSLLRFKAVCRSWNELIQNQQFIYEHHKTRKINDCILIKRAGRCRRDRVFSFVYSQSPTSVRVEDSPRLKEKYSYITVLPPCNGIFCVFFSYSIVLWNPALRQVKALPQCPDALSIRPPNFITIESHNLGLSYDPKSNAYKVIRIWVFLSDLHMQPGNEKLTHTKEYLNRVAVWEPGTNAWREIDNVPTFPIGNDGHDHLNLKGKCYWQSSHKSIGLDALVSFDMVHEVFQAIPLPDPHSVAIRKGLAYWYRAFVLNESIALLSLPLQHNEKCFEVWLMRESASATDEVSWSKHITVEKPLPNMVPLGFWKNGELIVQKDYSELVFLNTSTGEIVEAEVWVNNSQDVHVYNESLVSINEWI